MSDLNHFIVVRQFRSGDEVRCRDVVKEGTMATVTNAYISLVEITFQLTVLTTAVMFIFLGLPFTACLLSIPAVSLFMYFCVWAGHMLKALELTQDLSNIRRTYMTSNVTGFWVAEAFEPYFTKESPSQNKYEIFTENEVNQMCLETKVYRKSLVGTVGIVRSEMNEDCAWLRRMAVKQEYRRKGIGKALLNIAVQFCSETGFHGIDLVTTEWHDNARNLYVKGGFQLKQMYHRQLFSNYVLVLIYQLHYKIPSHTIPITP